MPEDKKSIVELEADLANMERDWVELQHAVDEIKTKVIKGRKLLEVLREARRLAAMADEVGV